MTLQLANLVIFFLVVYSSYGKELKECGVSQSAVVRVPLVVLRGNTNQAESQLLLEHKYTVLQKYRHTRNFLETRVLLGAK